MKILKTTDEHEKFDVANLTIRKDDLVYIEGHLFSYEGCIDREWI